MRKVIYLFFLILAFSCEESENILPTKESLIKRIVTTSNNFESEWIDEFHYDEANRLVQIDKSGPYLNQNIYYQYNDTLIIKTVDWNIQNMQPEVDTLYLSENGVVVSTNRTDYNYNSTGFLQLNGYTFDDNNVIEYKDEFNDGTDITQMFTYKCSYYENVNTVYYQGVLPYFNGNYNIGIKFWGKQNKNLLKKIELLSAGGGIYKEFKYKFDTYNRVSEMTVITWTENIETISFEYCDQIN